MKTVRLGIIGMGFIGSCHAKTILNSGMKRCTLAAVCDADPGRLAGFDESVAKFTDSSLLIRSGAVDAVLIATPHYAHTTVGIEALRQGLHVLVEKPISVHKLDCERLISAHRGGRQVFAAMFNQRTAARYRKVKELIDGGDLGKLMRISWIATDWFRSDTYYASGGWRATWAGEGGGVLLNQCPHQLDLLQWLCGMPVRINGFCGLGKRHRIEVEDEVTVYMEYANGATGVFITSTGEAPGTNRLEIAGDSGKIVLEGGRLQFWHNKVPASRFSRISKETFRKPDVDFSETAFDEKDTGQHGAVIANFVEAILDGVPTVAPAREGVRSVELANAALYSSITGAPVELPLDGRVYERMLKRLIRDSKVSKAAGGRKAAGRSTRRIGGRR